MDKVERYLLDGTPEQQWKYLREFFESFGLDTSHMDKFEERQRKKAEKATKKAAKKSK